MVTTDSRTLCSACTFRRSSSPLVLVGIDCKASCKRASVPGNDFFCCALACALRDPFVQKKTSRITCPVLGAVLSQTMTLTL